MSFFIDRYRVEVRVFHQNHSYKFVFWDNDCVAFFEETAAQLKNSLIKVWLHYTNITLCVTILFFISLFTYQFYMKITLEGWKVSPKVLSKTTGQNSRKKSSNEGKCPARLSSSLCQLAEQQSRILQKTSRAARTK